MTSDPPNGVTQYPLVRACIFDVDGLLIDSEDYYSVAMNNILHEYGKPDIPWSIKAKQQSRSTEGYAHVMKWAKLPVSIDEFRAKVGVQKELFRNCKLLPGVTDLLANLSSQPLKMAIASSASKDVFTIKTSHLPDVFSCIPAGCRIFGHDADMKGRARKPAGDIFLLALERINSSLAPGEKPIKPEECLVFEDSTAGVESGRRAGMRVVWVPHPGLLDVYRGREELVLAGMTDQDETLVDPSEDMKKGVKPDDRFLFSKDGKAQLVTSLEKFPYETYGLKVSRQ